MIAFTEKTEIGRPAALGHHPSFYLELPGRRLAATSSRSKVLQFLGCILSNAGVEHLGPHIKGPVPGRV